MNCKPGDLAVIVRGKNAGRFVEVLRWGISSTPEVIGDGWWVKSSSPLLSAIGTLDDVVVYADSWLRPIRDNDREDETLTWAGKPEQVTA